MTSFIVIQFTQNKPPQKPLNNSTPKPTTSLPQTPKVQPQSEGRLSNSKDVGAKGFINKSGVTFLSVDTKKK